MESTDSGTQSMINAQVRGAAVESKNSKESKGIMFSTVDRELRVISRNIFSARSKYREFFSGFLNYSRRRLNYKNIKAVVRLLQRRSKIVVLTGAGISVSCGIPDFRSSQGVYARLREEYPELDRPEDMFSLPFFQSDPRPFFTFAKEIFPGQFMPSFTHRFIRSLERQSKLLRNYTQNIDTLEQVAGISNVVYCHGSFATASCTQCKFQVQGEEIREAILSQRIPHCPRCSPEVGLKGIPAINFSRSKSEPADGFKSNTLVTAVMKPDIVFFHEALPPEFLYNLEMDSDNVDLLLVIGTSLGVAPVSQVPTCIPHKVPQILINREPIRNYKFDVELIGDCDIILRHLCKELGWDISESTEGTTVSPLTEVDLAVPLRAALKDLVTPSPKGDINISDPANQSQKAVGAKAVRNINEGRMFNLAQYLPENSYTPIHDRLYVFKGAELPFSTKTATAYLTKYSQGDGTPSKNRDGHPITADP
ncbi:hypothetical protein Aperf_G00000002390 [Anoplocephala perfoliata]